MHLNALFFQGGFFICFPVYIMLVEIARSDPSIPLQVQCKKIIFSCTIPGEGGGPEFEKIQNVTKRKIYHY